jgi:hypothetical protein
VGKFKDYMSYLRKCATAEAAFISNQDDLNEVEREDASDFLVYYWEIAVYNLEGEDWVPDMAPKTKQDAKAIKVPEDVANNVQGPFRCQSGSGGMDCGKAYVRVWLNEYGFTVDYCGYHFFKLKEAQKHTYTVLLDVRKGEEVFVR